MCKNNTSLVVILRLLGNQHKLQKDDSRLRNCLAYNPHKTKSFFFIYFFLQILTNETLYLTVYSHI